MQTFLGDIANILLTIGITYAAILLRKRLEKVETNARAIEKNKLRLHRIEDRVTRMESRCEERHK